ncbi:LamG-like jellyroll fold domain-containing protein [Corticicoccus populi]|uniref:LamG-like jellyroll fold domain-containing protein n=1 Tax=Corticicoccus populi TaxID=1812821 RepID=A0ABW5WS42_9STAP
MIEIKYGHDVLYKNEYNQLPSFKLGNNESKFLFKGDKLVSPNYAQSDSLILHYDFTSLNNNSTNRAVASDLSGNGNDGQLHNFNFTEESGYVDGGLKFDGVDDYVNFDEIVFDSLDEFTVELYISEVPDNNGSSYILGDGNKSFSNSTNTSFQIFKSENAKSISFNRKGMRSSSGGYSVLIDNKLSYSISVKNKEMKFYLDGKHLIYGNSIITDDESTSVFNNLGQAYWSSSSGFTKGVVSGVRIYNKSLSPEEIKYNYEIDKERF